METEEVESSSGSNAPSETQSFRCQLEIELAEGGDSEIRQLRKSLRKTRAKVENAESVVTACAQLKSCINDLELQTRERTIENDKLRAELVQANDHLKRAKDTIAELRNQNENLKEQVRMEVERRAKLELELQDCEKACAENDSLRAELAEVRRVAEDSGRLVRSSRRLQRQQADQLLVIKSENERLQKANEGVTSLEEEVEALRNLVCDKDEAMQHQARTMEALKELIQRLRQVHPEINESIDEFFRALTSEEELVGEEEPEPPRRAETARNRRRLLGARPKCGAVRIPSRSSVGQPRSVSAASSRSVELQQVGDQRRASQAASRASTRAEAATPAGAAGCVPSRVSSSQPVTSADYSVAALSKKRLDAVASLYVQLGSRVTVEVRGSQESGIVKYVGLAHLGDKEKVFVGIRLHSQQGNTDGTLGGIRYFTVPKNSGVFVRAHKILSVFNLKKNCNVSMAECIKAYLKLHQ